MQTSALRLLDFYQRRLSLHKGYPCAHRVHHGSDSRSEYGRQVIQAQGLFTGLALIAARIQECRIAYAALQTSGEPSPVDKKKGTPSTAQQGDTCANICTLPCL